MKKRIVIFFAAFVLLATACNDWLDVRPKTQEPYNEMFETREGYQDVLTGCYIKMKAMPVYGRDLLITTVEYLAQHWDTVYAQKSAVVSAIMDHRYNDDDVRTVFKNTYGDLYNIIVQANSIIEAMPLTGENAIQDKQIRGVVEGEALAIRAYCHFDILRLFGQVPGGSKQVKLPYSEAVSHESVAYYTFAEYTQKLEADLLKAEKLLEEHDPFLEYTVGQINNSGTSNGAPVLEDQFLRYRQLRLNYYAVKALQARFYLYIGGRNDDALNAARVVIDAGLNGKGFALAGESDINDGYNALPGEGLFMLSNHQLKDYVNRLFPGNAKDGSTNTALYMTPGKLQDMFEEVLSGSTNNRYNKLWNHSKKDRYGKFCPEIKKYYQSDDTNMGSTDLLIHKQLMPMLRLSEMYLIVIELSNDLNELNSLYYTYRQARNLREMPFYNNIDDIKAVVPKEYRCEFFAEGQMFFYYKRNFSSKMMWSDKTMTEDDYIVPLPITESNPDL